MLTREEIKVRFESSGYRTMDLWLWIFGIFFFKLKACTPHKIEIEVLVLLTSYVLLTCFLVNLAISLILKSTKYKPTNSYINLLNLFIALHYKIVW